MTLGGVNKTLFEGEINYINIANPTNIHLVGTWSIPLGGISVDGVELAIPSFVAIIDTGTSAIRLPAAHVAAIFAQIPGARLDSASNEYLYPCRFVLSSCPALYVLT